ncbi:MAG: PIN domain-containing protein [Nitrospira sp.]
MKALLDTNILIHREASIVVRQDIGSLFNWLDRLALEKWIHPISAEEISNHKDERVRRSFAAKLASYRVLRALAPLGPELEAISASSDTTENDRKDTAILNELFVGHVDILISEDRGIARKAFQLGISDRVFTIDAFLEKIAAENPGLIDYRVLSVSNTLFGNIKLADSFFDSFRTDYPQFDRWFNSKSQEVAYVCHEAQKVVAFLYLKTENVQEPYPDITPQFTPKKRLKIGTFKVELNGFKLGERFLKIAFDNALRQRVEEIYVTIFPHSVVQERLIRILEDFGFAKHGKKRNSYGNEQVFVRDMTPTFDPANPRNTFPFVSRSARVFLVPIYPEYHTALLPDSILNTESPSDFVEHEPYRNAIRKVYISRSHFKDLLPGDVIVFYRTGGYHKGVVTTVGIVESVYSGLENETQFVSLCRQRSVFSDQELRRHWNYRINDRPFVVNFLYAYSFPKRPNMEALIKNGVIRDIHSAPRGFERIALDQFETIIRLSETDPRLIVN